MNTILYGKRIAKPTKKEQNNENIIECGRGTRIEIYQKDDKFYFVAYEKRNTWSINSFTSKIQDAWKGSNSIDECKQLINEILGTKWMYRDKPYY